MPHIVELNQIDQVRSYRLPWRKLWQQTRSATFFQTLEWLETYWRHFGANRRLRILMVWSGKELTGILPLAEFEEKTRAGGIRVLTYPLQDWGSFYGPIGPNPAATLYLSMQYLASRPEDWEMLDLRWIDPRIDAGRTAGAMQWAGFQAWDGPWLSTILVDVSRGWDEYLNSRSSKFRNNLRRAEKRAVNLGSLRLDRYRPQGSMYADDDPRWDLMEDCLQVAASSWQAKAKDGTTLSHEQVRPFFRDTHVLAAQLGALDVNLLRLDEKPIAFAYNYVTSGEIYGLRMGYDPRFRALSPGRLLLAKSLEDSCRRGDRCLDLGPESVDVKRGWQTQTVISHRCTHYAWNSPMCQLLRLKRWLRPQPVRLSSK